MFRVFSSWLREGDLEFAFLWALNRVSVAVHEQKVMRTLPKNGGTSQVPLAHLVESSPAVVASRKSLIFNPSPCPASFKLPPTDNFLFD